MKQCPQCKRAYSDDNQFCLEDGTTLIFSEPVSNQSYSGDTPTVFIPNQQTPTYFSPPTKTTQIPTESVAKWMFPVLGLLLGVIVVLGFLAFYPRNSNEKAETASITENKSETPKPEAAPSPNQPEKTALPPAPPGQPPSYDSSAGRFPESSTRYLNENDLLGKSDWDLRIMRNEIFARHGYIFKKAEL